jgi:hypothetical protein
VVLVVTVATVVIVQIFLTGVEVEVEAVLVVLSF